MVDFKDRAKQIMEQLEKYAAAEESFIEFVKQAWPEVAGGSEFQNSWHVEAICEHLEALHRRDIRNLLVNLPPRMGKSLVCSVLYPAWAWAHTPAEQFLCTSYSKDLSFDAATKSRRLLNSPWYQRGWGKKFKIMDDQDAKGKFDNDKFGYRFTTSIDATTTGWGGNCFVGETRVITTAGVMCIRDIQRGHMVLSYNHRTGEIEFQPVLATKVSKSDELVCVTTNAGEFTCTPEHLIYLPEFQEYKPASWLKKNVTLMSVANGSSDYVESTFRFNCETDVYDIQVHGNNNFFANGILAHNCILIDDPNSARDTSDTQLESAIKWFTEVMPTRGNDPKRVVRMVIQQRVSEKDVSGHILSNDDKNDWVKLILPMEFEPSRRAVTIPLPSTNGKPWQDPRTQPNELMWPARIGPKELDNLKRELSSSGSSYAIAGQLQQRPAPESGGIYKREWFKLWPAHEPFPKFDYVVASYDTAYTDFKGNDPTACTVWGIFVHPQERRQCAMLLDCYAEWIDYPDLRRRLESDYKIKYGPKEQARKADYIIIETKGSGDALYRDLKRTAMPVIGYSPGKQGKKQRARIVSYLFENGMVYVPESENKPGKPKTWCEDFITQMCTFPNADHDDYVDSCHAAGAEVFTSLGLKKIEEIKIGDMVLTHKGRFMPVTNTLKSNRTCVSVSSMSLDDTIVSHTHPFWHGHIKYKNCSHRYLHNSGWKEAKLLKPRPKGKNGASLAAVHDCLAISAVKEKSKKILDLSDFKTDEKFAVHDNKVSYGKSSRSKTVPRFIEINKDFGWLCGMFAAEGCVSSSGQTEIACDKKSLERVKRIMEKISNGACSGLVNKKQHCYSYSISIRSYAGLFRSFGRYAKGKFVPQWALEAEDDFARGFIDGYMNGDGYIAGRTNRADSCSKSLLWGIRLMLLRIGKFGAVFKTRDAGWKPNRNEVWTLSWTEDAKTNHCVLGDEKSYHFVEDVNNCGSHDVYNIEVEEDHSYQTTSGLSHNCSQAMIHLKDRSLITVDKIPELDDQEVAAAIYKREQGGENPYAV